MKIINIEQTPNPNSVRIVLTTELPSGESTNYLKANQNGAQEPFASLLNIEGLVGIYHVLNFMAVEKDSNTEWDDILPQVHSIIPTQ